MSLKNDIVMKKVEHAIATGEAYLVVIIAGVCAKGAKKVEVISLCHSSWTIIEKILLMEGRGSISRIWPQT